LVAHGFTETQLAQPPGRVFIPLAMSQPDVNQPRRLAYAVDDEPMLLDLNETLLGSLGFDVKRFRAAELALEAYRLENPRPALIVTDFSMHLMTGLQLIEACRKLNPEQKFLLVSGTVDATAFRFADEKPDHFIPKPYTTDEFTAVVRSLVGT
jgi:DNA-binding NtrC family response regulator